MAVKHHAILPGRTITLHVESAIHELARELPEDEQPSGTAVEALLRLLDLRLLELLESSCASSTPRVSTLGDGDLILEWIRGERRVLLFVLPSGSTRLQQVTGNGREARATEVARNLAPAQLRASLEWLVQA